MSVLWIIGSALRALRVVRAEAVSVAMFGLGWVMVFGIWCLVDGG